MDLIDDPMPGQNTPEYTVSEISGAVKRALEDEFGRIRVKGEVGRVFKARSGHLYYDVKDDRNVLACTTWKGQIAGLSVVPEEGLEVVVTGRLSAFGAQSKYNMNVDEVAVAGQGALMALLEKRKKAMEAEGLFAPDRKRALPYLPEVIGVVTSPQGAVIRDILHRLRDRFPRKVLIWPVAVQGANSAPEVARAIEGFNAFTTGGALPRPDLLIVARGGGSLEDLWGFNEEVVARAAAASDIPLISAVGHETDTTLIDFVSDQRAPTPTAAAEMAVPVRLDLLAWIREAGARLDRATSSQLGQRRQRLADLARALPAPERLLDTARQRLDRADRLAPGLQSVIDRSRRVLAEAGGGLRPSQLRQGLMAKRDRVQNLADRLSPALSGRVIRKRDAFAAQAQRFRPDLLSREVAEHNAKLADHIARLQSAMRSRLRHLTDRLGAQARVLETVSYAATLQRGYAVVRQEGEVITRSTEASASLPVELQFADGRVVIGTKSKAARKKEAGPPEQGSLF